MRRALLLSGAVVCVAMFAASAMAQTTASYAPRRHTAPAPLVAAGIPALIALGGMTGVNRLLRRSKGARGEAS
jgi:hypothetical protein